MTFEEKAEDITNRWMKAFRDLKDETMGFFEDIANSDLSDAHKIGLVVDMTTRLNSLRLVIAE